MATRLQAFVIRHVRVCAGLLRQQAEQAATALSALPSVSMTDVKAHVSPQQSLHAFPNFAGDSHNALHFWVPSAAYQSCGEAADPILVSRPHGLLRCGLGVQVDGEDEGTQIQETDIVTCSAKVILSRPSHTATGTAAPSYLTDRALSC